MSFIRQMKRSISSKPQFVPKRYQKNAIGFGLERPAAGFFLAPGLGKTMIILTIFRLLKKLGLVDELFVLAKRRIIYEVWPKEIAKWDLPFTHSIVHGSKKEERLWEDTDVKLMNYESLEWFKEQKKWFKRGKRVMLAVDESSKLRHTRTIRFKSLKKVLGKFKRRYILTGSPAPNGLIGLFGQTYVLDLGDTFGKFITHFRNRYFTPAGYMGTKWKLQKGADKKIFKKLRPLIIRYGTEELDLPPITFIPRYVHLDKKARRIYDEMEREMILQFTDGDIVAANAAVMSGKCRQIANGGVYYNKSGLLPDEKKAKDWKLIHEEKCAELVELLEELQGEPALVAFEYGHDIERFRKYAKAHAPQYKDAPVVDGKTKDKDCARYLRQWEKGELPVMFGHPDSVAHGLNLQGKGGIVIFFSLTWNLENYEQFYQRVWRQGQTKRVLVYQLIAKDTVDEVMIHALAGKDRVQQSLLRAMEKKYGLREKDRGERRHRRELRKADREERARGRHQKGRRVRSKHE